MGAFFAVCLMGLGIVMGATLDMARLTSADQKLQNALDGATLLATTSESDDFEADAQEYLANKVAELDIQSLTSSFTRDGDKVIGQASGDIDLMFGGLLNKSTSGIGANTVVNIPRNAPCIIALSQTRSPGILMNSGAEIVSSDCEVHTHSVGSPAMTINAGTTLGATRTCISGGTILNHSSNTVGIETNCSPAADPYAGRIPVPDSSTCDYNGTSYSGAGVTMNPGVYCGWHNFNSNVNVTFNPGLYVLKNGGWNVSGGDWNGNGVTFYYADNSKIQFNSGVDATIKAPLTGPYAGVFMAEAPGLSGGSFILNDTRGFDFEGVIHLPSREFIMNGGGNVRALEMSIVANNIIINTAKLQLEPVGSSSNSGPSAKTVYISE